MCGHIGLQQGVAIGGALGHVLARNGTAAARNIFNDDALPQNLGQTFAGGAANHVCATASGYGYHIANGLIGVIALRIRPGRQSGCCRGQDQLASIF